MTDIAMLIISAILWLTCGALGYAMLFGYMQGRWPHLANEDRGEDQRLAMTVIPLGAVGLAAVIICIGGGIRHGLKWW